MHGNIECEMERVKLKIIQKQLELSIEISILDVYIYNLNNAL